MTHFQRRKVEILGCLRKPQWTLVQRREHAEWVKNRALRTALNRIARAWR